MPARQGLLFDFDFDEYRIGSFGQNPVVV